MTSAIATGTPLAVGEAAGRLSLGLTAALGAVTATYYPSSSWRYRARALPLVAVGAAAAATLGATAGERPWPTAVVVAVVALVATVVFAALLAPPPGAVPIVVTCGVATQLPVSSVGIETRAALTLAGAAFAYLVTMAPAGRDRAGPSRRAVASALRTLAALAEEGPGPAGEAARVAASREIRRAEVIVARDQPGAPLTLVAAGMRPAFEAVADHVATTGKALPVEGARWLRAQARWVDRRAHEPGRRPRRGRWRREPIGGPPDLGGGQDARRLAAGLRRLEVSLPAAAQAPEPVIAPTRDLLVAGLRSHSPVWPWAARVGVAAAGAALLAIAVGIERPYWAPVAAVTVLEARAVRAVGMRTAQRAVGTGLGALGAVAVLALPLPVWALIALAAVLQGGVQIAGVANSALGALLLTPQALLLVEFARPGQRAESLVTTRLVDTMLGLAVGLAAALVLWPRAASHRLPRALAECVSATGALLEVLAVGARDDGARPRELVGDHPWLAGYGHPPSRAEVERRRRAARHRLETAREWLSEVHAEAEKEPGSAARETWPAVLAARRLSYTALTEPRGLRGVLAQDASAAERSRAMFEGLAHALAGDGPPTALDPSALPAFAPLRGPFGRLVDAAGGAARAVCADRSAPRREVRRRERAAPGRSRERPAWRRPRPW